MWKKIFRIYARLKREQLVSDFSEHYQLRFNGKPYGLRQFVDKTGKQLLAPAMNDAVLAQVACSDIVCPAFRGPQTAPSLSQVVNAPYSQEDNVVSIERARRR